MAKDAVATMGTILTDDVGGRDAVHVAVIAVAAAHQMAPGQRVGLSPDRTTASVSATPIGIVDPFLEDTVQTGQRFWLYLYPRTITSLRHNWTHPEFSDTPIGQAYSPPSTKLASEQWIRNFAEPHGVTYADMIEAANAHLDHGDYLVRGGEFEGISTPDEFWIHFERATGRAVDVNDRENFFSCSC